MSCCLVLMLSVTLLMLVLSAAVTWAVRKGKLYAGRRFVEGTQRDEGAAVPLAEVVASSTKDGSEPLTRTTSGKTAAKITANKELETFCSFLETSGRKIFIYFIEKQRNYLSMRYGSHLIFCTFEKKRLIIASRVDQF